MKVCDFSKVPILSLDFVGLKEDLLLAADQNGLVNILQFKDGLFSMKVEKFHL